MNYQEFQKHFTKLTGTLFSAVLSIESDPMSRYAPNPQFQACITCINHYYWAPTYLIKPPQGPKHDAPLPFEPRSDVLPDKVIFREYANSQVPTAKVPPGPNYYQMDQAAAEKALLHTAQCKNKLDPRLWPPDGHSLTCCYTAQTLQTLSQLLGLLQVIPWYQSIRFRLLATLPYASELRPNTQPRSR